MKDETDKEIIEEVRPTYERIKTAALARLETGEKTASDPGATKEHVHEIEHVRANERKLTLMLYLSRRPEGIEEQFEYYDYRYFHRRIIANTKTCHGPEAKP